MMVERKKRCPSGRTQRMMSFRLDNDLREYMDSKANKSYYLNSLIRKDYESIEN